MTTVQQPLRLPHLPELSVLPQGICVGNIKGGVSKSTTAVFIALWLAKRGARVLLVDTDGSNLSCLDWSGAAGEDWPQNLVVVGWHVGDLLPRVKAVQAEYDFIVFDTSPHSSGYLRQALYVSGELIVPVSAYTMDLRKVGQTFALAAEIDAVSPVIARVLLSKVKPGTRKLPAKARAFLDDVARVPRADTEISLLEYYADSWGSVPDDLGEFDDLMTELLTYYQEAAA